MKTLRALAITVQSKPWKDFTGNFSPEHFLLLSLNLCSVWKDALLFVLQCFLIIFLRTLFFSTYYQAILSKRLKFSLYIPKEDCYIAVKPSPSQIQTSEMKYWNKIMQLKDKGRLSVNSLPHVERITDFLSLYHSSNVFLTHTSN